MMCITIQLMSVLLLYFGNWVWRSDFKKRLITKFSRPSKSSILMLIELSHQKTEQVPNSNSWIIHIVSTYSTRDKYCTK